MNKPAELQPFASVGQMRAAAFKVCDAVRGTDEHAAAAEFHDRLMLSFPGDPAADIPTAGWPAELTPGLLNILGRPNFSFIGWAQAFRLAGIEIPTRSEDEQAFFIHRLLGHWFAKGEDYWQESAQQDLADIHAKARAALAEKKDPA